MRKSNVINKKQSCIKKQITVEQMRSIIRTDFDDLRYGTQSKSFKWEFTYDDPRILQKVKVFRMKAAELLHNLNGVI